MPETEFYSLTFQLYITKLMSVESEKTLADLDDTSDVNTQKVREIQLQRQRQTNRAMQIDKSTGVYSLPNGQKARPWIQEIRTSLRWAISWSGVKSRWRSRTNLPSVARKVTK